MSETALELGETAPDFTLPDTDGTEHRLAGRTGAPATVVVFTCNHCPYALAWHDRIAAVAGDHVGRGVTVFNINANDASRYPDDSLEAMRTRVAREGWQMPYLHDQSQEVARAFGAQVTPDVFVLDAELRLRYRGAPDSGYDDPGQDAGWLRSALDAVLAGRRPDPELTDPVGCSIKWRP